MTSCRYTGSSFFASGRNVRPDDHERHSNAVIVQILFAHQTVLAARQSVIGGEKDPGVVRFAGRFERVQNASDHRVHVRDDRVVLLAIDLDRIGRARKRCQLLVTQTSCRTRSHRRTDRSAES